MVILIKQSHVKEDKFKSMEKMSLDFYGEIPFCQKKSVDGLIYDACHILSFVFLQKKQNALKFFLVHGKKSSPPPLNI